MHAVEPTGYWGQNANCPGVVTSMCSISRQLMEELLITVVKVLLWWWALSAGMGQQEVSVLSLKPRMTPCCFRMKALSGLSRGAKGKLISFARPM